MLHQYELCVYKGKRKLILLITVYFFRFNSFFFFFSILLRKCGKKVKSKSRGAWGGGLERVGRVTLNTTFFFFSPNSKSTN